MQSDTKFIITFEQLKMIDDGAVEIITAEDECTPYPADDEVYVHFYDAPYDRKPFMLKAIGDSNDR